MCVPVRLRTSTCPHMCVYIHILHAAFASASQVTTPHKSHSHVEVSSFIGSNLGTSCVQSGPVKRRTRRCTLMHRLPVLGCRFLPLHPAQVWTLAHCTLNPCASPHCHTGALEGPDLGAEVAAPRPALTHRRGPDRRVGSAAGGPHVSAALTGKRQR